MTWLSQVSRLKLFTPPFTPAGKARAGSPVRATAAVLPAPSVSRNENDWGCPGSISGLSGSTAARRCSVAYSEQVPVLPPTAPPHTHHRSHPR